MSESLPYAPTTEADVCLLLEGTCPYVRGGVSTWVKQIIEGLPELTFSIIFLGASEEDFKTPSYEIPGNVIHVECHCLLKGSEAPIKSQRQWFKPKSMNDTFELNDKLHESLRSGQVDNETLSGFAQIMSGQEAVTEHDLQHHRLAWESIRKQYLEAPEGLDFNHYFWTIRSMHGPLFVLSEIAENAPAAKRYHSVSTGYAGFLGALLKSKTGRPLLVSEHGIYTKERELDLAQVNWIPEDYDPFRVGLSDQMSYLRRVWIRFFSSLGRMTYAASDEVFTLYEGNRLRQLKDGADEGRLRIIPNGVAIKPYAKVRRARNAPVPPVIGLIGRVVPIKDIKTFIRAMRVIRASLPEAQGWLIGPEDEDPIYTEECKQLVSSLDLEDAVIFKGFQKPAEMFPKLALSVLTSVSEGQPLVALEGFAAGIPAVTTDVGSCSELIFGVTPEDKAIGAAGAVVPMASPTEFANAVLGLLSDQEAWQAASDSAVKRVETYYTDEQMIESYRDVYSVHSGAGQDETRVGKAL